MSQGPKLDDLIPLLGDDEVLRLARENGLSLSVSMDVLDRLNLNPVRPEIVEAARSAVKSAVLVGIYMPQATIRAS